MEEPVRQGKGALRTLPMVRKDDLDPPSDSDEDEAVVGLEMSDSEAPSTTSSSTSSSKHSSVVVAPEYDGDDELHIVPKLYQSPSNFFFSPATTTTCVLSLGSYSECFMRTDLLEPLETRAISETLLENIKHHMKFKGYLRPLAVHFRMHAAKRRPEIESIIIRRLHEVGHFRYRLAMSTIVKDCCWGIICLLLSFLLLYFCGHVDELWENTVMRIFALQILAVSMWYLNWQGFDFLVYIQRSHWGALKFFRAFRVAEIVFVDQKK
jgi:hypothetical protein